MIMELNGLSPTATALMMQQQLPHNQISSIDFLAKMTMSGGGRRMSSSSSTIITSSRTTKASPQSRWKVK